MVEQITKRDLLVESKTAFIGDDTGLIKKVKVVAKRTEQTQEMRYDLGRPMRKKIDENGKEIMIERKPGAGALNASDNQKYVKQETELTFKLLAKYGNQQANQGIQCIGWASHGEQPSQISYVRGEDNIVQIFDIKSETVLKQREYADLAPIKGLHSLKASHGLPHVIVDQKGNFIVDDLFKKQKESKPIKVQCEKVHKTYLKDTSLAVLSKGHPLQIWDVNSQKLIYHAKNVKNDELDLKVPIFDTGLAYMDSSCQNVAVSTGYGHVRQYDFRVGKKCRSDDEILADEMMLTHILQSLANDYHLYVITQSGQPLLLDRRFNCRTIRRMPGAKGTVRDCQIFGKTSGYEFVMTVGCDRYLRVFDASKELQKETNCGTAYLKQKLNCILLSEQLN